LQTALDSCVLVKNVDAQSYVAYLPFGLNGALVHKKAMQSRESRYQKVEADINAALNHQEVEPDVPSDAKAE
jgi:hypothetical protein